MRKANLVTMSLMVIAFSLATTIRSSAQTLNTLVNFDGANGITGDTVIQGKDGNFSAPLTLAAPTATMARSSR